MNFSFWQSAGLLLSRREADPGLFRWICFSSGFANLLGLASCIYAILIFNRYVGYGLDGTLITLTVGALIAILLEFFFKWVRGNLANALLQPQSAMDDDALLEQLNSVELGALNERDPGFTRRLAQARRRLAEIYTPANFLILVDLPFVFLFLLAVSLLHPVLGLLALALCGASLLIARWHGLRLAASLEALKNSQADFEEQVSSSESHEVVRAFNLQAVMRGLRRRVIAAMASDRRILQSENMQQTSNTQLISALTSVVIIGTGAVYVTLGELDIGSLIGANILATRAVGLLNQVGRLWQSLVVAAELQADVDEALAMPVQKPEGTRLNEYSGRLQLRDLQHTWDERLGPLFSGLSVDIKAGEVILVCGNNGTGKSTLAKIMAGLIVPQRGQLLADGVDLLQIAPHQWHEQVSYVAQEPEFVNLSLRDNLTSIQAHTDESLRDILKLCDVLPLVDHHPQGLDQKIAQGGQRLPPGIRKRLAMARAVAAGGKLVLMDETHTGMDQSGLAALMGVLKRLTDEGRTIILFAHDRGIIQRGARVIDLNSKPVPVIEQL